MLRLRVFSASAFVAACSCVTWADSAPVEVVKKLNAGLESVLKDAPKLDYKARYERLVPVLTEAYDFDFMASQAVGKEWDALSANDQRRWVKAFSELTFSTYASRFDHYSGQTFTVLGEEEGAHDTVVVRSQVVDPGHDNVDLTYRLREKSGAWKVIDVYLKGSVSEIALRRSEFAAVLKREGFEALLAGVNRKLTAIASGTPVQ